MSDVRKSKPVRWIITGSLFVVCEVLKTVFMYLKSPDVLFIVTHVLFDFVFLWVLVEFFVPLCKAIKNGPSNAAALLWLIVFFLDCGIIWFATDTFFETGRMPAYGLAAPAVIFMWKTALHENK